MTTVDTLIEARWIIPIDPSGVFDHHALVLDRGIIAAMMPVAEARARYSPKRRIVLERHALIPGLINLHTHAAMTLMRGLADDRALMEWLKEHIWPVEMREASPEFVYDGTLLACAEMLRGGITLFNDMYFFPAAAAQAAVSAGMRAALGMIVVDFPSPYASDALDYLAKGIAVRDQWRDHPLVSFCFAPHAPYSVSDKALAQVATYANEIDVPIHIHLHETLDELQHGQALDGRRPLARLAELGLVGPNLLGVHAVHVTAAEIELLAAHGSHVVHCPSSNMKLASGMAPIAATIAAGVNVGIGTDGAASNNRLDMFTEMRQAALLAKAVTGDPTALPAHQVLEMATLNGAKALGLSGQIGSLTRGKAADVVAVDLGKPELAPCYDPVSHLVYAASRHDVSHVWIAGEMRVESGALINVDLREVQSRALHWQARIAAVDAKPSSTSK